MISQDDQCNRADQVDQQDRGGRDDDQAQQLVKPDQIDHSDKNVCNDQIDHSGKDTEQAQPPVSLWFETDHGDEDDDQVKDQDKDD